MKKKSKKKGKKAATTEQDQSQDLENEDSGDDDASDADSDEAAPKKTRPAAINYETFVKAWRDAGSISEVAEALGIQRNSVSAIAGRLRGEGVKLKDMPRRTSQPIDVKHLNKIADGKID